MYISQAMHGNMSTYAIPDLFSELERLSLLAFLILSSNSVSDSCSEKLELEKAMCTVAFSAICHYLHWCAIAN